MESTKYKVFFDKKIVGELSPVFIGRGFNGLIIEDGIAKITGPEDFENALMNAKSDLRGKLGSGDVLNGGTLLEGEADELNLQIAELEALHEGFKKALLPEPPANDNAPEVKTEAEEEPKEVKPVQVIDYRGKITEYITAEIIETRPDKERYEAVYSEDGKMIVSYFKRPRFVYYVGKVPGQVVIEGENITNETEAFEALQAVTLGSFIKKTQDVGLQSVS